MKVGIYATFRSLLITASFAVALVLKADYATASSPPYEIAMFRELCVNVDIEASETLRRQFPVSPRGNIDTALTQATEAFIRERVRELGLLYPVGSVECFRRRGSKWTRQTTLFFHVTLAEDREVGVLAAVMVNPLFEDQQMAPHAYPTRLFRCASSSELQSCVEDNVKAYFDEVLFPLIQVIKKDACPPDAVQWRPHCPRERQPRYPD
jgi:hypothetical protein